MGDAYNGLAHEPLFFSQSDGVFSQRVLGIQRKG